MLIKSCLFLTTLYLAETTRNPQHKYLKCKFSVFNTLVCFFLGGGESGNGKISTETVKTRASFWTTATQSEKRFILNCTHFIRHRCHKEFILVNDVHKEFILAPNKRASPYIDMDSGVALIRIMLNHNAEQKYTKFVVTHLDGSTSRLKMALVLVTLHTFLAFLANTLLWIWNTRPYVQFPNRNMLCFFPKKLSI